MPEFRDNKKVLHAAGEDGDGEFFIRRASLPRSLVVRGTARKHLTRRYTLPSSNKENMPPVLAVKATHPKRRSSLPKWYPRVPLCDIMAIAKAIQQSRLRIAAAQEQSRRSEQSPQSVNLTTPAQAEQDIPLEASFADASSSGSAKIENVSSPTIILAEDYLKVFSSPAESSMKRPTKPTDPSMADTVEKKLSTSIEQVEKMVKNMQRTPKAAQRAKRVIQRRTLMTLR